MRLIARSLAAACAAASLATAPSAAPQKPAIASRMAALAGEIDALRARGAGAREIHARRAEYDALVAALGGGDPVAAERARALAAPAHAPRAVTPVPPGTIASTASFTASPALAIPDLGTVSDSIAVTGVGTYVWDVDLTTNITHTWCGDLDIYLIAPSGKRVTISTDVAEGYVDCFAGTLWDDSAPNAAFAYPHVNNVTSTPLDPEGKLHRLAGDDPTGLWTLSITDDAGADVGVLHSWSLNVTTLSAPPGAPVGPATFSSAPALPIDGSAVHADTIDVGGVGTVLAEVRVRVELPHTWSSDLVVDLVPPSGAAVRLSTLNGSDLDDVFDGTDFFDLASQVQPAVDPLRDQPIDEYPFVDLVAAVQGDPEGSLTRLIGSDPNGTWTLQVVDTYPAADDGVLESWQLEISTYLSAAVPYCAPIGPTAGGCTPTIAATENPNVSHTNACVVTVTGVDGDKSAIIFYGNTGPNSAPWCGPGNGASFMCVNAPTQRTGALNSGGTSGACDGALVRDWNAYQLSHPGTTGQPWLAGDKAWVQGWFRSPLDCKTTFLSQAIELTYQP